MPTVALGIGVKLTFLMLLSIRVRARRWRKSSVFLSRILTPMMENDISTMSPSRKVRGSSGLYLVKMNDFSYIELRHKHKYSRYHPAVVHISSTVFDDVIGSVDERVGLHRLENVVRVDAPLELEVVVVRDELPRGEISGVRLEAFMAFVGGDVDGGDRPVVVVVLELDLDPSECRRVVVEFSRTQTRDPDMLSEVSKVRHALRIPEPGHGTFFVRSTR